MALAIRFEQLVADGVVDDFAELSRLGHVTRARMTKIMNLLHLASDVQEAILILLRVEQVRDPVTERELHGSWGSRIGAGSGRLGVLAIESPLREFAGPFLAEVASTAAPSQSLFQMAVDATDASLTGVEMLSVGATEVLNWKCWRASVDFTSACKRTVPSRIGVVDLCAQRSHLTDTGHALRCALG